MLRDLPELRQKMQQQCRLIQQLQQQQVFKHSRDRIIVATVGISATTTTTKQKQQQNQTWPQWRK
jgi:hypothetical protein